MVDPGREMMRSARSFLVTSMLLAIPFGFGRAAKGPILQISDREVDFGRVEQFSTLEHQVLLGNEGDAPLRILKVETSCGCTVAIPSDSVVFPGRETKLNVTFQTKDVSGKQEKRIVLRTNDPAEPTVNIMVRADVRTLVRLSEDLVSFETIQLGSATKRSAPADKTWPEPEIDGEKASGQVT
jgi:hypothetical protein